MTTDSLERLIDLFAALPGLGPRSARRAVLYLIQRRQSLIPQFVQNLKEVAEKLSFCQFCNNLDTVNPCTICADPRREETMLCVVEDVADLWALERAGIFKGRYHVLGGVLSAMDGVGPEDLRIPQLIARAQSANIQEVVLATNATVDGQTTAHYIADHLGALDITVSRLAQGLPVGGELDYLDAGTLTAALKARRRL